MSDIRFTPSPAVSMAELDGEMVLLDSRSGKYFGLDTVASSIWNLVAKELTEAEIVAALLAEYDVSPARVQADVTRLLTYFEGRQLVVASNRRMIERTVAS